MTNDEITNAVKVLTYLYEECRQGSFQEDEEMRKLVNRKLKGLICMYPITGSTDIINAISLKRGGVASKDDAHAIIDKVVDEVCQKLSLPREDIISKKRDRTIQRARAVAMYLSYYYFVPSTPIIADFFNCDHTSVLHNMDMVRIRMENETGNTKHIVFDLIERLGKAALTPSF
jgi:hypothetical protein